MTTTTSHALLGYDDLPGLISLMTGDEKHDAAATSTLDVVWVLYDQVLRIDPRDPEDPARDRFLLSKGHGPMAYYATLAAKGFFPVGVAARAGPASTRPWATTPTVSSCPASRSGRARWATACRSPSGSPSGCGRSRTRRGSSSWSATPSSTRAATPRRSRSRPPWRSTASRWWWSTTARPATAHPDGSRSASPPRGGRSRRSTVATTTRWRPRCGSLRPGRPSVVVAEVRS